MVDYAVTTKSKGDQTENQTVDMMEILNSHLKMLGWRVFWLCVLCNSIIIVQGVLDPVSGMAHRAAKPQWDAEGGDAG